MTIHQTPVGATRRAFLAGGVGLVIGVALAPRGGFAAELVQGAPAGAAGPVQTLNAFVRVAPDGTVTVLSKHIEFGQGPYTGLATLVAEEMDADWSQMRAAASPADDTIYANLAFGLQGTGGSTAMANSYEQMRKAGATARAMLVTAAAMTWGVPPGEITVGKGRIRHAGRNLETGFGEVAELAAAMMPPKDPPLKDPATFTLIGRELPKLDTPPKTDGTAIYTLDVIAEDMLVAMVAHPEVFGATVRSFDDAAARAVPGVVDVKAVPQGVAVYAENTFAALKGRAALTIDWDLSAAETRSSEQLFAEYRGLFATEGLTATDKGDVAAGLAGEGVTVVETEMVFPFLAHAPMEPLDAVIIRDPDGTVDAYNGAQFPGQDRQAIAQTLALDLANVRVHCQLAGGSFGRRAQFGSPYMREAAAVFAATDQTRPVKHMWTREDDIRGGFYRPIYVHSIRGGMDARGRITGWDHKIAGQSLMARTDLDETSVEGASDLAYAVENLRVVSYQPALGVPVLWWRSVGHTHTAFAVETFLDQMLRSAGKDPVRGRLDLLGHQPRHTGVLTRVAEMADWGGPVPEGRARGVAVHKSFNTYVAEIAEVSTGADGLPRVHKVWCAVDCGVAINPNVITAQMEGGIGYGLGAVLFDEITLGEGGKIIQSNFHDYRSLRISEMPEVEVSIIASTEPPTGVGEPGVPPIGPAVANAWRVLTGQPIRRLPLSAARVS
ncbi:MAG: twin-arginine translocation pathway signal protein [Rhodovulum sulfidophilum]|uniref:Twin-arginine translocation pathway signal protein n=1 Tax=Rhodovulum sulfidophilum TaxID=35806 RepID=A0A2W5NBB4_RHOSU|nr:MAG: twin-arginine translocation pathway signal protein [Rhodovulum sulfidophilum]